MGARVGLSQQIGMRRSRALTAEKSLCRCTRTTGVPQAFPGRTRPASYALAGTAPRSTSLTTCVHLACGRGSRSRLRAALGKWRQSFSSTNLELSSDVWIGLAICDEMSRWVRGQLQPRPGPHRTDLATALEVPSDVAALQYGHHSPPLPCRLEPLIAQRLSCSTCTGH
jgi:hypothetical protein